MGKFPAYGMAGIGIAAAIGFVFALSLLSNNVGVETDSGLVHEPSTAPSSLLIPQRDGESSASLLADSSSRRQDMAAKRADTDGNGVSSEGENARLMMQSPEEAASMRPTLISIIASDGITGETIGEVTPEMQFEADKPVFIRADLVNLNDVQLPDHIIALGISRGDETSREPESENATTLTQRRSYEEATSFHGDIGTNGNVELELYWNPARTGEYTLVLFSIAPDDFSSSAGPIEPVASIPIQVVEPTGS